MNSNTTRSTKSTQELKQQVLSDIQRVKDDFEEIKTRMTPGQLIDDAIYYRRGDSSPAATFEHLKRNPVGTSFLTIGTLLLMEDEYSRSYESIGRERMGVVTDRMGAMRDSVSGAYSSTRDTLGTVADKVGSVAHKLGGVKDKIASKLHRDTSATSSGDLYSTEAYGSVDTASTESFSDRASEGFDSAKSTIREGVDSVRESMDSARSSLSGGIDTARSSVRDGVDNARGALREGINTVKSSLHSATDRVKESSRGVYESARNLDPMTYLVLGAGLGTITGAALPVSEVESRLVDDKLADKMTLFRTDLEKALNESANILKNEFMGGLTHMNFSIF